MQCGHDKVSVSNPKVTNKRVSHAIVFACDESYAMPLATVLRSLIDNSKVPICYEVIILTSAFSSNEKSRVERSLAGSSVELKWVTIEVEQFARFLTRTYISKMTFARLQIADFVAPEISRILYLDADLLVTGEVSTLLETDLGDSVIGAVLDSDSVAHGTRLGLRSDYFNAGVLIIDVEKWREKKISEKALRFMTDNPETLLADQDALNVACRGHWKQLSARWNCQHHPPKGYLRMPAGQWPSIIHFAGRWKPWNPRSLSPDATFYDAYRRRTKFAKAPIERLRDAFWWNFGRVKESLKRVEALHKLYTRVKRVRAAEA